MRLLSTQQPCPARIRYASATCSGTLTAPPPSCHLPIIYICRTSRTPQRPKPDNPASLRSWAPGGHGIVTGGVGQLHLSRSIGLHHKQVVLFVFPIGFEDNLQTIRRKGR